MIADLERGGRVLLIARQAGRIAGTVQLEPASKRNATHRAEVQKLLVQHQRALKKDRRRADGAIEAEAIELGRALLVLDTVKGEDAERLYPRIGYLQGGRSRPTPSTPTAASMLRWFSIALWGNPLRCDIDRRLRCRARYIAPLTMLVSHSNDIVIAVCCCNVVSLLIDG